jgi:hypothetical protein
MLMSRSAQLYVRAPNYSKFSSRYIIRAFVMSSLTNDGSKSSVGQLLYYLWNVATVLVLLNILISLFASAYSEVSFACPQTGRVPLHLTWTDCQRRRGRVSRFLCK